WNDEGEDATILAKTVILAAGAVGSTELLLKSTNNSKRARSESLQLSDALGKRFSTNGDLLGVVQPTKMNVEANRGPIVTSAVRYRSTNNDFMYTIEDSGLPKMFAGASRIISDPVLMKRMIGLVSIGYVQDLLTMISKSR